MKGKLARAIATAAAGAMVAMASAGVATATIDDGKGASSTKSAAGHLLDMRDQLTTSAYNGDVTATKRMLTKLDPVLADLAGNERYAMDSKAQNQADKARTYASEASRVLDNPTLKPRQLPVPPTPEIPDLPPPLDIVSNLLKNVLASVTGLLGGLLGSPQVPPLPIPEVPVP